MSYVASSMPILTHSISLPNLDNVLQRLESKVNDLPSGKMTYLWKLDRI